MFSSIFGLKGLAVAGGISLLVGIGIGWSGRDYLCDAASAKAELENERAKSRLLEKQLKAQREISSFAIERQTELLQNTIDLERKVSDYETELTKKPVAACAIDDADLRFRSGLRKQPTKR